MTAADPGGGSRARVISCLVASVPGLDTAAAQRVLAVARMDDGRALREVEVLLKDHPGALVITPAAYPLALVRLAHSLIEAGYPAVAAPACAGCGKVTTDLRRKTASDRVCGTCAARSSTGTCARCGRARRINARRPEGGICSVCYDKDEQVVTECSGCGRKRRVAARMPDGTARCQFCATRPARMCSACGQQRTVAGSTDAGPVCASCYQAPQRPCGRCGRTRKIARRATGFAPDLCYGCYQGAVAVCSVCGETRPCQRISSGSPICRTCRTRPPRPCFRCGRDRPVQAEWPAGPVCVGCYEHVRRHPAECAGCGVVRPLIGSDEQGRPVCGPCAGAPGLDYTCRECGRGGEIHSGRRCFSCVLAERARVLLAGPGGEVSAQLQPLLEALSTVSNPATVVSWLGTSRSARLLGRLARTGDPITHDLLDDLPQTQALHYVREVLVTSGVLPSRNEHLERLAPWLEHLLHDKPAHHARLIRPSTYWFVLRRARRGAARRTFTRGSADFARARVLAALDLLSWLDHRGQAQAWWLLEPRLGARARVARLYVLRRSSAARLEQTAQNMGLSAAAGYGALVQELDDLYQGELGLTPMLSPKGNWTGCENQKPFDYTTRVKAFMEQIGQDPAAGPYAYYSGASHAELWRIQYSYEEVQRPDGQTVWVPRAPVATVNAAVSVCIDALTYPVARAFALLGRGASSVELHQLRQPLRAALTLT